MTNTGGPSNSKFQRPRGQGWAAFDRKQREKQGTGKERDLDPFPSVSKITSVGGRKSLLTNNCVPIKPFSSVIRPSVDFPPLLDNCKGKIMNDEAGAKHDGDQIMRESDATPVKMLKDIHMWADKNLIEDILAAVNNDIDQASVLLKSMASPESILDESILSVPNSSAVIPPSEGTNTYLDETISIGNKLFDGNHGALMSKISVSVPVEPEYEEDDVYLSHRKDALRMMRVASQHSRAASNSFLRGDHISAQQHSSRAHDKWLAAEKLNARAAKEILWIRNNNNGMWKIDLHGLHASEAVSALKEHLDKIEYHMIMSHSASSDALAKLEGGISRSASCESFTGLEINNVTKKMKELPQHRRTILHVITGAGNHSRGQAALPAAIRSFLIENGYRFDEARAGVFDVRPKFRKK